MAPNNAGGFGFALTDWQQLDRFLILGTEGGTYYVKQEDLTRQNVDAVKRAIAADGMRVVDRTVDVSVRGLAPKNDPALYVLALCLAAPEVAVRRHAAEGMLQVARIPTHEFMFNSFAETMRGRGATFNRAVRQWYESIPVPRLAALAAKYRERGGWAHRDLLRLVKPKATDPDRDALYGWMVANTGAAKPQDAAKAEKARARYSSNLANPLVALWVADTLKRVETAEQAAQIVYDYGAPWEVVPSEYLTSPLVWRAMLTRPTGMPLTAMVRNLASMTTNGTFDDPAAVEAVLRALDNPSALQHARVHPIQLLAALEVYGSGHGARGSLTWKPNVEITHALERAFRASFAAVDAIGKRLVVGVDSSGSMEHAGVNGIPGLQCKHAAAALALVYAARESQVTFVGFHTEVRRVNITGDDSVHSARRKIDEVGTGGTDCALPVLYAIENAVEADAFIIFTDSESWAGDEHCVQALERYRARFNPGARLVNVQMAANTTSIRDSDDAATMEVVGLDPSALDVVAHFVRGDF